MPCSHRFIDKFPTRTGLKFLFIGTFNPEWDSFDGVGSEFFYGRSKSLFWCILPHAFEDSCLIDKGPKDWEYFCQERDIGLIDLVAAVENAEFSNDLDRKYLTDGYKDSSLEVKVEGHFRFELHFTTSLILKLVENNSKTLQGIILTRTSNQGIPRIWAEWLRIKEFAQTHNIPSIELPTPSTRGIGIMDKIRIWRNAIRELRFD